MTRLAPYSDVSMVLHHTIKLYMYHPRHLSHGHLLDLAQCRLVLDGKADQPCDTASGNDGDQTFRDSLDIGVNDRTADFGRQRVDGHRTLTDKGDIDASVGSGEFAVEEDGLYSVDDTDADGGAGELGKGDDTVGLGNEVRAAMVLDCPSVKFGSGVGCRVKRHTLNSHQRVLERDADTDTRQDLEADQSGVGSVRVHCPSEMLIA